MKQPDANKFAKAYEEIAAHHDNAHWQVVPGAGLPANIKVVPSVWAMKRKRCIDTQKVYKWKGRLNVHGGKQEYGAHYSTGKPMSQSCSGRLFAYVSSSLSFIRAGVLANSIWCPPTHRLMWSRSNIWRCLKVSTSGASIGRLMFSNC